MILRLESAYNPLENLVKMQIMVQESWVKAQNCPFLTTFQVMPVLVQDHTLSIESVKQESANCSPHPYGPRDNGFYIF